jgi:hypothetical protein
MAAFGLSKEVFVATSAAIDFGVDISRSVIYLDHGYFTKDFAYLIPFLIVISFLGSWIGKRLLKKINEELFRKIVLFVILITGVLITYQECMKFY